MTLGKDGILEIDRGSTRSHSVENLTLEEVMDLL
jgi:hypothetical protein